MGKKRKEETYENDYKFILSKGGEYLLSFSHSNFRYPYFTLITKTGLKRLAAVKALYMDITWYVVNYKFTTIYCITCVSHRHVCVLYFGLIYEKNKTKQRNSRANAVTTGQQGPLNTLDYHLSIHGLIKGT